MKNHRKKFFQLPQIVGGKEALQKYIDDNLIYPEEARIKRIEGVVHIEAEIDDNGIVIKVDIIKGLAGGCNEEAIRLIKKVQFGGVKNKGFRVKTKKRFRIKFQLPPEKRVNYQLVVNKRESIKTEAPKSYSYKVQL